MVTLSAILCTVLLTAAPEPSPYTREVLTEEQLWTKLRAPDRSIFHLPKVADPWAVPRLPNTHPRLEELRLQSAALRPLRLVAALLGGAVALAGTTYLAATLSGDPNLSLGLAPHLPLGLLLGLPVIPLGVSRFGGALFGHGTLVAALQGAIIGFVASFNLLTFLAHMGGRSEIATYALLSSPLIGAVVGYELSSHARLSAPMGPRHPVLPLKPRVMAPFSFAF